MIEIKNAHPSCGQVGCQAWKLVEENERLRETLRWARNTQHIGDSPEPEAVEIAAVIDNLLGKK